MLKVTSVLLIWLFLTASVYADLLQAGDKRWVVLASTTDFDAAVGVANAHLERFQELRVVEATNGWLAVVAGPVSIASGAKAVREELRSESGLPDDLFLSDGSRFLQTVWTPAKPLDVPTWDYDGAKPLALNFGSMEIQVTDREELDTDFRYPLISLRRAGELLLEGDLKESALVPESMNAQVRIALLDRSVADPQIVFSSYSMGAHCCTVTKILTNYGGTWVAVEGRILDGEGYRLGDVDGDGSVELLSVDNSFLYAFSPFALSWAPPVVERLQGIQLVDMRWNSSFRHYYRRELFQWEHIANLEPDLWRQNGFLGAWVGLKALVGEFEDAWPRMLLTYDKSGAWPLTRCEVALVDGLCPEGRESSVDFPTALREHLERNGYLAPKSESVAYGSTEPEPMPSGANTKGSSGTGFFVSANGYLATNYHVIEGCTAIRVHQNGSGTVGAKLVASDKANDLALLKAEGMVEAIAPLRSDIRLGEQIAVFGYPLSSVLATSGNFTSGNVTALAGLGDDTRFIQISAPIQPGNSGGPLLDSHGNVVGIVTAKLNAVLALAATGDIPQNVNFALRSAGLHAFLQSHGIDPIAPSLVKNFEAPELAARAVSFSVAITCH
jgi:hypothetical protein